MKKVWLFIICLFMFINVVNAECTYTDIKNLNALATYIEAHYDYNGETFSVLLNNVPSEFYVKINDVNYYSTDNSIVAYGFSEGEKIVIRVYSSSETNCLDNYVRHIEDILPYVNKYYDSPSCVGNENLDVCKYKFLDYQISESNFKRLIENNKEEVLDIQDEEEEETIQMLPWYKVLWNFVKDVYVPVLLVVGTSGITILIYSVIYRKIKHGL